MQRLNVAVGFIPLFHLLALCWLSPIFALGRACREQRKYNTATKIWLNLGENIGGPGSEHDHFVAQLHLGSNHKIEKHGHKHRGTKHGFILSHSCTARVGYQRSSMVLSCVQALFLLAFLLVMQSMSLLIFLSLHKVPPSFTSFSFKI